jgi:hypothetical protein
LRDQIENNLIHDTPGRQGDGIELKYGVRLQGTGIFENNKWRGEKIPGARLRRVFE